MTEESPDCLASMALLVQRLVFQNTTAEIILNPPWVASSTRLELVARVQIVSDCSAARGGGGVDGMRSTNPTSPAACVGDVRSETNVDLVVFSHNKFFTKTPDY